jgi:hypothetical protein
MPSADGEGGNPRAELLEGLEDLEKFKFDVL